MVAALKDMLMCKCDDICNYESVTLTELLLK